MLVHTRPYPNSDHTTLSIDKTAKLHARGDSRHKKKSAFGWRSFLPLGGCQESSAFQLSPPGTGCFAVLGPDSILQSQKGFKRAGCVLEAIKEATWKL